MMTIFGNHGDVIILPLSERDDLILTLLNDSGFLDNDAIVEPG